MRVCGKDGGRETREADVIWKEVVLVRTGQRWWPSAWAARRVRVGMYLEVFAPLEGSHVDAKEATSHT